MVNSTLGTFFGVLLGKNNQPRRYKQTLQSPSNTIPQWCVQGAEGVVAGDVSNSSNRQAETAAAAAAAAKDKISLHVVV
jgi:hypothetical protein